MIQRPIYQAPACNNDTWILQLRLPESFGVGRNNDAAIHLVSKWAGHSGLTTTLKYLYTNESYEYLEMDKMLETEKANEKIVSLDEYRKAS